MGEVAMNDTRRKIYNHLLLLRKEVTSNPLRNQYSKKGICDSFRDVTSKMVEPMIGGVINNQFREYMCRVEEWHHFSGDDDFPVPDPHSASAIAAAAKFTTTEEMWVGEYGKLRLELLDWLINRVEQGEAHA